MICRVSNNKKIKRFSLILVSVISVLISGCQPEKMPWQELEIVNETPPHILDETQTADDIPDETVAAEETTTQYMNEEYDSDCWNRLESSAR